MEQQSAFHLDMRADHVAVITIAVPDDTVNTLKAAFVSQIRQVIQQAQENPKLVGMVLISGKPDSFIAGADIAMIAACESAQAAESLARQGQEVMAYIAALPFPVVVAIHGPCLGGGLELALACDQRICSLDDKTQLGLPEVKLGLLPGSGGTQRLPRLIGTLPALTLILSGKHVSAKQAVALGLVDDAVPAVILLETAVKQVLQGRKIRKPLPLRERVLSGALVRPLLFSRVAKQTRAKTQGHYPATDLILHVVRTGLEQGSDRGYAAEAKAFGELAVSAQSAALRSLFFAATAIKKARGAIAEPRPLQTIGVLGGGLMGGGIACVTALRAKLPVRIKDIDVDGINHALKYSWDRLSEKIRRKKMNTAGRQRNMALISASLDYRGFRRRDVIIEAVFEELSLKQKMVAEIEQYCAPYTVFASNTSSLPISAIAAQAQRPENVIGLHYFSPVDKMPLVEVIPHAGTSAQTIATTVALAKKQGKTPIVVADRAGFYVNRILAPYINEAMRCLLEGEPIDAIDEALVQFGFPVGPIQLLDEVGIDVGTKIIPILESAYGERFSSPLAFSVLLADDRKGRKNGRGFYLYRPKAKKKKMVDKTIYQLLNLQSERRMDSSLIAQRCVMMLLNEAVRCRDESVIHSLRDGDLGAVMGIGFPPFLGGPFYYLDQLGVAQVVETLTSLTHQYGDRFTPCDALHRCLESGDNFYKFIETDNKHNNSVY